MNESNRSAEEKLLDAVQEVLEAYHHRFGVSRTSPRYHGPIDREMESLRSQYANYTTMLIEKAKA